MGQRPSAIYGITPKYTAWCFDRAVELFGRSLEEHIRVSTDKIKDPKMAEARAVREMHKWLGSADPVEQKTTGRFRDPIAG